MLHKISSNRNRKCYVILILVLIVAFEKPINCLTASSLSSNNDNGLPTNHFVEKCKQICEDQNRTHSDFAGEEDETLCKNECRVKQCGTGCSFWESALDMSCQKVCNKTEINDFDNRQMFCVKGCNHALYFYFEWIKQEISSPMAPALVPDSLTSTSLSLEWFVPSMFLELAKGNLFKKTKNQTYFVQCLEEAEDEWKKPRKQTIYENSTIHLEGLQPYTKYKFRVALLLSEQEAIYSEPSVVISTNEEGPPDSKPNILQFGAVDQSRIMVSWKAGPKNNGPVIAFALQINETQSGYTAIKEVLASNETNYYIFEKLSMGRNYSIQIKTRNARGVGPASEVIASTAPLISPSRTEDLKIILASENTISSQSPDFLVSQPITFYSTSLKISGIALDVRKKLIFAAEDDGCIYQASLDASDKSEKSEVICQNNGLNFKPLLLSVDWLNDHLYVLGETITSNHHKNWMIARCNYEGKKLVIAIGVLNGQPLHIEVDPYNGYLFWVIPDDEADSGLYRLDLGDISNGIKHETKPFTMIKGKNLGAFIVDHARFRLMVPMQNENTIMTVSLNGKDKEDIRQNTQSPLLHSVKSLAMANGVFFWTNGKNVITEEYHPKHNSYYHNSYPDSSNTSLVAICVNSSASQPIPVPVNPPHSCQALLSSTKAKVSWEIPQLVGDQGKGAFKNWFYRLYVDSENDTRTFENITGHSYVVQNMTPNTLYSFKVAAYTSGGSGQWSQEFKMKTLKTSDERYLVWASNEGLMQSDATGEDIITLLPKEELGDAIVNDITWFEDLLYIVTGSTLKIYNRTNGSIHKVGELDSVGGVAVDWIGKRLYWSNPTQQVINRGRLNGEQQEPLSIVAGAREIKIDSLRGNLYYSTGLTVEGSRLNGKNPKKYFTVPPYSGKQVMGLALDLDDEMIYWIVRSYQGSSLYSAKLLDSWILDSEPEISETKLMDRNLNGSLTLFSDRLVWRQDDKTVVFSDMEGKNLAYFRDEKLLGLTCLMVIDKTHHSYPISDGEINVIPGGIPTPTVKIIGTYKFFNITWENVTNVNYGSVFYEIKIKSKGYPDLNKEQTENVFQFPANTLEPYTHLEIFIRAFTYWGSSPISKLDLYSPPGPPSEPTNPRVYTRHMSHPLIDTISVEAIFRWSKPDKPNGNILGYKVNCYGFKNDGEKVLRENKTVINMQQIFKGLRKNDRYTFEVQAYTSVGEGNISEQVYVDTIHERPVPIVLVATQEEILSVDLDNPPKLENIVLESTRIPVVVFSHIAHERKIFWFDENNDLIAYHRDSHNKTKLISTTSSVKCMTIDWIERIVYWSQIDDNKGVIYSLNLNRAEMSSKVTAQKVHEQQNVITDLVVSPFDRKLFWIENHKNLTEESGIYYLDLDSGSIKSLFVDGEECMNKTSTTISPIPGSLVFATSPINPPSDNNVEEHQTILIFEMNNQFNQQFVATKLNPKECFDFGTIVPAEGTNLAKDSNKVYWIHGGMVYAREDATNKVISQSVPQKSSKLLAFYQQRYPSKECLAPKSSNSYKLKLKESTDVSLTLELPKPELPESCKLKKIPIRYTIFYIDSKNVGKSFDQTQCYSFDGCNSIKTFQQTETIPNLKPFTNYFIRVGMSSVFDKSQNFNLVASMSFRTEPGRPSPPRNLTAVSLSYNEILVTWLAPEIFNSPNVTYEIHWQQENVVEHIKQQRILSPSEDKNRDSNEIISTIVKVQPSQTYSIFVRAYSKNQTYSESNSVTVDSYPVPNLIQMNSTTPTSMIVLWKPSEHVKSFRIVFAKQDSSETMNVTNYLLKDKNGFKYFQIDQLEPKTKYNFSLLLIYINSERTYKWSPPEKLEFETLGTFPSPPGRPIVERVTETVYKVSWNASKENGAPITEYILESKKTSSLTNEISKDKENRVKRSVSDSNDIANDHNEVDTDAITEQPDEIDDEPEEKWIEKYRGSELHWIVADLNPIDKYLFRVSAVNSYGVSGHSQLSEFLNATAKFSEAAGTLSNEKSKIWLLISLPVSIIFLGLFLVCAILIVYRNQRNKKFNDDISPIPDFELRTLHDPLSGEHLIMSNRNILYNQFYGSAFINTEIKHLPQIHSGQIIITDRCLGKGAFGEVWCGILKNEDGTEERVAIKTLHKGANDVEKREFLQEAQLMSNFKHDHILRLVGVCLNKNESLLYIVMELMEGGDLLSFLRNNRPAANKTSSLRILDLISMCVDVASGCRYLEEMHFVHRDIAARNCLVKYLQPDDSSGYARVVKIGDFGLARDIYKNDYYRKEGEGLLPVRWMSPESLIDGVFTSQSDIWAFGVLMWEVITLGQQPYQGQTNIEVLQYVRGGGRLPRPNQNCPEELYQLMAKCWNRVDQRPTFRYCLEVLQQLHERKNLYSQIEAQFPHDVPYKYVSSDDSSILNEKIFSESSNEPVVNSQGTPSIPKYLELMYDENDSRSLENMCEAPVNPNLDYCEKQNQENDVSYRNSHKSSDAKDDGYEIPISLDPTLDVNANNELNNSFSKSRTLSNSSTVSNKSEHFPILPEAFTETCLRSSLILERDNKIYPKPEMFTRQSGWV